MSLLGTCRNNAQKKYNFKGVEIDMRTTSPSGQIVRAQTHNYRNITAVFFAALLALFAQAQYSLADEGVTAYFSKYSKVSTEKVDHSAWSRMLSQYVSPGADGVSLVDYAAWKATDHKNLKAYLAKLQGIEPRTLARNEQFAYWANLYNAKTIDVVLDHYPVQSIRDISINEGLLGFLKKSVGAGGPWKAQILEVAGKQLSLDDIEHKILRPIFKDPRVHYAVNCASIGCPNLQTEAFSGTKLENQLNAGAKAYVNSARGISVQDGEVHASSIYQWFQTDFGGSEAAVLDHVRQFANPTLKAQLKGKTSISSYGYDWSLNTIKRGS